MVKVSAIGIGMRSHAGVAARAFKALADKGINIRAITTSEIKFSVLIDAAYTELAVRTLHTLYGLDQAPERSAVDAEQRLTVRPAAGGRRRRSCLRRVRLADRRGLWLYVPAAGSWTRRLR